MNFSLADKAMKDMNRRNLRSFCKLKQLKFDELNILAAVNDTYDNSIALAKKRYKQIAVDAFIEAMLELSYSMDSASKLAEETITDDWILDMLEDYDTTTLYQFLPEADRKKQRLVEAIIATQKPPKGKIKGIGPRQEIDRALRIWTRQVAQYADRSVVDGTIDGYKEAGVENVKWVAVDDEKTCPECKKLNGKIFPIDNVPARPHYACRCRLEIA